MNNRKIIFGAIGATLLIIISLFLHLAKGDENLNRTKKASGEFKIWIVGDSEKKFSEFISTLKSDNKSISNVKYIVQSFPNYEEYTNALNSAIIKGVAPDIFVLNNNETSLFEEKVWAISNSNIDIHQFRKEYKGIFIDDLIVSSGEGEEKEEYLKGIPVGYETLGILYNARYRLKRPDFNSISSLRSAITKVKDLDIIPIAIGNGSTILDSGDLLAQQFLLNKIKSLDKANKTKIEQTLSEYMNYGSLNGDNSYNSLFDESISEGKNNIELFSDKKVAAIVAYPRVLEKLQAYGFSSKLLFATPYPHSYSGDGPSLANYNYFVINKDSSQINVGIEILKYLNTDKGANALLSKYKYYLPAKIVLESELGEENISNYFKNIQLRDFYSDEPLSSFNKANKVIYDREIKYILDNPNSYLADFDKFKESVLCKSKKILTLENLSNSCE